MSKDTVELLIEARNLATAELDKASNSVEGLGKAARETERNLNQLEIDSANLESFREVQTQLRGLREEAAAAEVAYNNLSKEVKQNAEATEEQQVAVVRAKQELAQQKAEIREVEREYNRLSKSLRENNINLRSTSKEQKRLADEIEKSKTRLVTQTRLLDKQTASLKEKVVAEQQSRRANEQTAKSTVDVAAATRKYEEALEKLIHDLERGNVTKAEYIRNEANLRKELKLTEGQVKTSRAALQAESTDRNKSVRSTDALTAVTRRLAQAYTVLIAAQSGIAAVQNSVQGYGDLEKAMSAVEKTTGLAASEIIKITDVLREQSETVMPGSTNELLRYAEVAGQLGTKSSADILRIVAAADALQQSTNLAGDEAATLLTRILQMTGEGVGSIGNLGSSFVELGNDAATTEADIAAMTKEIVTGTRSIELSSAAAAGLGTTLLELGLPAERSRTAIQRLSEVINQAAVEGGESLEQLSRITGQTADELTRNLGERPEAVLQAFLEGLVRVEEQGQVMSQTLKDFGIEGQDAIGVFNQLAGNTELLAKRINQSNEAYTSGTALMKEASKAYATQNADISRLVNQFNNLRDSIGEAFTDETNEAVDAFSKYLADNEDAVISIMEWIPQMVEGFDELMTLLNDAIAGDVGVGIELMFKGIGNTIRITVNTITLAIREVLLFTNEARIKIAEFAGASDETLQKMRESSRKLSEGIKEDSNDIGQSVARLMNESSRAYEDFQDAIFNFGDELVKLDPKLQAQIQLLVQEGKYVQDNEAAYRTLTAAIIKNHREVEVQAELAKREAEAKRIAAEEAAKKLEVQKQEIEANKVLQESYTTLIDENGRLVTVVQNQTVATRVQSDEMINLQAQIAKTKNEIATLERASKSLTAKQAELAISTANLAKEKSKLAELRKQEADLIAIETARYSDLRTIQFQYQQQLDALTLAFNSGRITLSEYLAEKQRLVGVLATVSSAMNENTKEVERNTEAVKKNAQASTQQVAQQEQVQRYTNLAAGAYAHLNKEFDFTNQSLEQLNSRSKELVGHIRQNQRVTDSWWRSLAELSNQAFERERQIIKETVQLREWEKQVQSGNLTLRELDKISRQAARGLTYISSNQMQPLINAIEEARQKLKSFRDEVADITNDIQNRLDEAEGNLEAIAKRRFQREQAELENMIHQAKLLGDNRAVADLRRALEQLRKAQNLEFQRDFGKKNTSRLGGKAEVEEYTKNANSSNSAGNNDTKRVIFTMQQGGTSTDIGLQSEQDADRLMEVLSQFGQLNIQS